MGVARKSLREMIKGDTKLTGAIRDQVKQDIHAGEGELRVIPLDKIDLNPHNPRRLLVSPHEILTLREEALSQSQGDLKGEGEHRFFSVIESLLNQLADETMKTQLEKIYLLAKSIEKHGLIQPIAVFQENGRYTIMAGERRFLAHLLIGRPSIRALARERMHDEVEERAGSLIENIARVDLTVSEKIEYIEELCDIYKKQSDKEISAEALHDLIHESVRSCRRYLRFIQAPEDVRAAIRAGELSSVREIEQALKLDDEDQPKEIAINTQEKDDRELNKRGRGRAKVSVSLGRVKNPSVIESLISSWAIANNQRISLDVQDWNDLGEVQLAWEKFLSTLEEGLSNGK